MNKKELDDAMQALTRELTDQGKLIEVGFILFRTFVMAKDAPLDQIREMRLAFMAGAEHLFTSVMSIMEPGTEPTDKDMARLDMIANEINAIRDDLKKRIES